MLCCIGKINPEIRCYSFISEDKYCRMHKNGFQQKDDRNDKGDMMEKFIHDILIKSKKLRNVQRIGRENGSLDIIYNYKNEEIQRGIQVKTLYSNKAEGAYSLSHIKKYQEDTIIVTVDLKYEIAAIINRKIIGLEEEGFRLNSNNHTKYKKHIFDLTKEKEKFEKKLFKACKKSTVYSDDTYDPKVLKEKLMCNDLKKVCKEYNFEINFEILPNSPIDCILNNYNCQLKFSNVKRKSLIRFSCFKTKDSVCGLPYHIDDNIDFFILAYLNEEKYIYYIIPSEYLLKKGYIATNETKGKASINVAPIDYEKSHWSDQFRDNFILLSEIKENMLTKDISKFDVGDRFFYECETRDIFLKRDTHDIKRILFNLKDKIIRCYETFVDNSNKKVVTYQFNLNDKKIDIIPNFYIFRINIFPDHFYIIPHEKFVQAGTFNYKRVTIHIPPPGEINWGKPWISDYLNNYDILKNV